MGKAKKLSTAKTALFQQIANFLFVFLIFALPVAVLPSQSIFGFELPKVFLFQLVVKILFFLFLGNFLTLFFCAPLSSRENRAWLGIFKTKVARKPFFIFFIFFCWLVISSAIGVDWKNSFYGSIWRRQGLTFWLHGFVLIILLKSKFISLKSQKIALFVSLSTILPIVMALYQSLNLYVLKLPAPSYAGRVAATFGQPNFLAGYMLMSLPFSVFWGISLLQVLVIFLTFSRGAVLTLAVLVCFWLFLTKRSKKTWVLGILGGLGLFGLLGKLGYGLGKFSSGLENRLAIWQKAALAGLKRPIAGYGLENIQAALGKIQFKQDADYWLQNVDRAHNLFLDVFLTSGVVGLGLFGLLVFITIKKLLKRTRFEKYLFLSFLAFLLYGIQNTYSAVHWVFFFLILGLS